MDLDDVWDDAGLWSEDSGSAGGQGEKTRVPCGCKCDWHRAQLARYTAERCSRRDSRHRRTSRAPVTDDDSKFSPSGTPTASLEVVTLYLLPNEDLIKDGCLFRANDTRWCLSPGQTTNEGEES
ncbi:hypothetical protein EYF80_016032 [Liparis tanakae]|uniref:Uncharacterized protein n=1 Tax=Liparis tanakae TaxID=230148 RepID=A0A4Z2I8F0_9TELE|nr:hypothetical protein EYF80_016032 [Liparis tanakae]